MYIYIYIYMSAYMYIHKYIFVSTCMLIILCLCEWQSITRIHITQSYIHRYIYTYVHKRTHLWARVTRSRACVCENDKSNKHNTNMPYTQHITKHLCMGERQSPQPPKNITQTRLTHSITLSTCAWARDRAHSLRYDAVLEIHPNTYSIVWIIWCTISSPKSKGPWPWPSVCVYACTCVCMHCMIVWFIWWTISSHTSKGL